MTRRTVLATASAALSAGAVADIFDTHLQLETCDQGKRCLITNSATEDNTTFSKVRSTCSLISATFSRALSLSLSPSVVYE